MEAYPVKRDPPQSISLHYRRFKDEQTTDFLTHITLPNALRGRLRFLKEGLQGGTPLHSTEGNSAYSFVHLFI